jgi:2-succinyl-5-enolpyruvyl-6-hydroxy-3-cyclohexene-1-carboxylate synthase
MENSYNIKVVVELLKKNGINQIVISPGGTNVPFVKMVQNDPFFKCYSVVDERSAIYFAIGLYLQTGKIIATSCTSAQATRNYIPGLTEAYYKRVPILAITMSKHPRFTYQEYMQAPDQVSLPKDSVKKSFMLPFLSNKSDLLHSIRLVNEAIITLTNGVKGPVQLCIPWLDFPLDDTNIHIRKIEILKAEDNWNVCLLSKKVLIVIGEHLKFSQNELNAIEKFCEQHNAVIYTNHLSNYSGKYSVNGNFLLSVMQTDIFTKFTPDIMITIGGQTGDYPLYTMLSKGRFSNIEHWRVAPDGMVIDTYDKLTKVFECQETMFFERMTEAADTKHDYYELWNTATSELDTSVVLPFSNASIARYLHNKIPDGSIIQFSILNSLRIWNLFDLNPNIECYSNVGAFGIDGGMSTLIGQSVISNNLSFMIIGDLAFYYDMNSIAIRHIKRNLRILLINNNGGIEFKLSGENNNEINRYIAAANHFKNAKGWAETCGFEYMHADSQDVFEKNCNEFLSDSEKPILYEVFVSDIDEAYAYNALMNSNRIQTLSGSIKNGVKSSIKNMLGESKIEHLKQIIK